MLASAVLGRISFHLPPRRLAQRVYHVLCAGNDAELITMFRIIISYPFEEPRPQPNSLIVWQYNYSAAALQVTDFPVRLVQNSTKADYDVSLI